MFWQDTFKMFIVNIKAVSLLGGGWAWVFSKDILLKCRTNDDGYSSAGVGGMCVGIFSSLQGWLCVGVLCALQCAKNSVGSCRQSHGCLNVCRMSNRVTHNGRACCCAGIYVRPARNCSPIELLMMKIRTKAQWNYV